MRKCSLALAATAALSLTSCREQRSASDAAQSAEKTIPQTFLVRGVIQELRADGRTVVIAHETISNYMPAMTMPFRVLATNALAGLQPGDAVTFRLLVTGQESWIDGVSRTAARAPIQSKPAAGAATTNATPTFRLSDIPDFAFTNEFGQPVSLRWFKGQAVAFTFIFTRCPIPEFCPRLSKNFQEASQKLVAQAGAPTNWHLLSVSFDPFDRPSVLRAYAQQYRYDSNHWSFLTGPREQIQEFARGFGLVIEPEAETFTHSFRTVVFDAAGRFQTSWFIGGDTSDTLLGELVKAAGAREVGQ